MPEPTQIVLQPAAPAPSVFGQIVVGALAGVLAWVLIDMLNRAASEAD